MAAADEANYSKYYPDDLNKNNQVKTGEDYFTVVVPVEVESMFTESTCTAVESTVVNFDDGVTLLQLTATKATKANVKNTFFIFVFIYFSYT